MPLDPKRPLTTNGCSLHTPSLLSRGPQAMSEYVYPVHFGMASTAVEREAYKSWMEPVTHVYSKGMATNQEPAVSKVRDSEDPATCLP